MTDTESASLPPFLYMSEDFRQFSSTVLLVPLPPLSSFRVVGSTPHSRASGVVRRWLEPLRSAEKRRERPAESRIPLDFGVWNAENMRRGRTKRLLGMTKTRIPPPSRGLPLCVFARKVRVCVRVLAVLRTIETRCPSTRERRSRGNLTAPLHARARFLRSVRQWQASSIIGAATNRPRHAVNRASEGGAELSPLRKFRSRLKIHPRAFRDRACFYTSLFVVVRKGNAGRGIREVATRLNCPSRIGTVASGKFSGMCRNYGSRTPENCRRPIDGCGAAATTTMTDRTDSIIKKRVFFSVPRRPRADFRETPSKLAGHARNQWNKGGARRRASEKNSSARTIFESPSLLASCDIHGLFIPPLKVVTALFTLSDTGGVIFRFAFFGMEARSPSHKVVDFRELARRTVLIRNEGSLIFKYISARYDCAQKEVAKDASGSRVERGKTEKERQESSGGQRSNQKKPGAMAKRSVQRVYPFETRLFSLRLTSFVLLLHVIFATLPLSAIVSSLVSYVNYYTSPSVNFHHDTATRPIYASFRAVPGGNRYSFTRSIPSRCDVAENEKAFRFVNRRSHQRHFRSDLGNKTLSNVRKKYKGVLERKRESIELYTFSGIMQKKSTAGVPSRPVSSIALTRSRMPVSPFHRPSCQREVVSVRRSLSRFRGLDINSTAGAGHSHANSGVDDYGARRRVTHGDKFTFSMGELCGYKKHQPATPAHSLLSRCENRPVVKTGVAWVTLSSRRRRFGETSPHAKYRIPRLVAREITSRGAPTSRAVACADKNYYTDPRASERVKPFTGSLGSELRTDGRGRALTRVRERRHKLSTQCGSKRRSQLWSSDLNSTWHWPDSDSPCVRCYFRATTIAPERHTYLERSASRREINIAPWKSRRRATPQPVVHHRTNNSAGAAAICTEEAPCAGSCRALCDVGTLVNTYVETNSCSRVKRDINYPRNADGEAIYTTGFTPGAGVPIPRPDFQLSRGINSPPFAEQPMLYVSSFRPDGASRSQPRKECNVIEATTICPTAGQGTCVFSDSAPRYLQVRCQTPTRHGCAITYTLFRARIRPGVRPVEVIKIPFIRYSGCSKQMTHLANSTGSNFPFRRPICTQLALEYSAAVIVFQAPCVVWSPRHVALLLNVTYRFPYRHVTKNESSSVLKILRQARHTNCGSLLFPVASRRFARSGCRGHLMGDGEITDKGGVEEGVGKKKKRIYDYGRHEARSVLSSLRGSRTERPFVDTTLVHGHHSLTTPSSISYTHFRWSVSLFLHAFAPLSPPSRAAATRRAPSTMGYQNALPFGTRGGRET
ncbi:hypothetical protein DBV15_00542 [Temnothorax longispinosus]|uniref:Uncharacterized protein n=1 Tax=Temnothorax longispinosus TaxID=300112 RepID=A0A4S2KSM9_9HYME|nr:hypothetical protein DBV15_00542 [Temnothorax longispinosus]